MWPFAGKECADCTDGVGYDASQWTGVEANFPAETYEHQPTAGRLAFLNPFKWGRNDDFHYEGEVIEGPGCTGCGVAGVFPGNGQCNGCMQETVSHLLDTNIDSSPMINSIPQQLDAPAAPAESLPPASPMEPQDIPTPPSMGQSPMKVVKPHSELSGHLSPGRVNGDFSYQQQLDSGRRETGGNAGRTFVQPPAPKAEQAQSPLIPTTIVDDRRAIQNRQPNSAGLSENSSTRPARIVNQFNDQVDWANLPKPKSIGIQSPKNTGTKPSVEFKTYGNGNRVIEFVPPAESQTKKVVPGETIQVKPVTSPPQDPKSEKFTLKDLFPGAEDVVQESATSNENESPLPEPPSVPEFPVDSPPTESVIENDHVIQWGLPRSVEEERQDEEQEQAPPQAEQNAQEEDNWEEDDESEWNVDGEENEWEDDRDDAIYEDEEGDYEPDADFGNLNLRRNRNEDRIAKRSEKDIIRDLRNSTVPNQVVFDNSPQIPEQQIKEVDNPVTLAAKPVPHYQELRHLAQLSEVEVTFDNGPEMMTQRLPKVRKVQAMPVSSQRIVEETEQFDFQPLPNLMMPEPVEVERVDLNYLQEQAFDPDSILNNVLPPVDNHTAARPFTKRSSSQPMKMASKPRRNAAPIVLRAAPTFTGSSDNARVSSTPKAQARIRFVKPSYQREYQE